MSNLGEHLKLLAETQESLSILEILMKKEGRLTDVWNTMFELRNVLIKNVVDDDRMKVGDLLQILKESIPEKKKEIKVNYNIYHGHSEK
jgi:uncharacterized protein with HEPN domain